MEDQNISHPTKDNSIIELIKFVLIAIIITIPIRLFIARPFMVSGNSMVPTFEDGQYLIVDEISYRFEKPKRGDIIIFHFPEDTTKYYIKRVIGLPGETIKSDNGAISINNTDKNNFQSQKLIEKYVINHSNDSWIHTLGQNEYFVMGDNRPESSDSRSWGNLNFSYIVGRPIFRLLPLNEKTFFPGESRDNQ